MDTKNGVLVEKLEHFRHILLFEFNRGANEAKAARKIYAVYGDKKEHGKKMIFSL